MFVISLLYWLDRTEWWGTGMVICLERGADLHIAQLMPLPLTVSCFSKIQIGFTFWFRLTQVVPDKGPLNGCMCVWLDSLVFSLVFPFYHFLVHRMILPPPTFIALSSL